MKPIYKTMLIEALRSGKYKQSKYFFLKENLGEGFSYCAIGLLNELAGKKWNKAGLGISTYYFIISHEDLQTETGLTKLEYLSLINQNFVRDFNGLADWIEFNIQRSV